MKTKNDAANYRKMSEPFETAEAANEAVEKFYEMVRQARNECRIADVLIVISVNVLTSDGQVGEFTTRGSLGDSMKAPMLAAYVYGKEQARMLEVLNQLAKG